MLFKRRISVSEYCTTRLDLLLSPQQAKIWTSARAASPDPAFRQWDQAVFLANMRAAHLQLLGIPITRSYPFGLSMEASEFIDDYLARSEHEGLKPLVLEYNSAFGSSPTDGVLAMAQLFGDKVGEGRLAEATIRQLWEDFYAALRSVFDDFKKVRLVSG